MAARRLILGLREMSRPVGEGYIYYKFLPKEADRGLLFLNLYHTNEVELEGLFRQSILEAIKKERLAVDEVQVLLSGYATENMRLWTQQVLARVVSRFLESNPAYQREPDKLETGGIGNA